MGFDSAVSHTWVYIPPEQFRQAIEHHRVQIATDELILAAVERGETIITGESAIDSSVSYFTGPHAKATPFD